MSVGDHALAYRCNGAGTPGVVVEAGEGAAPVSSTEWDAVLKGVEPVTRICVYDRAPLGLSYVSWEAFRARTAKEVVDDLHNLLQNAHIEGPYVLVGHSMGGFFVRYYATTYLDELAGIVLVDATPPDYEARELALLGPESPGEAEGITQYRKDIAAVWGDTAGAGGGGVKVAIAAEQAAQLTSLGDLPLVVLSRSPTHAQDWYATDFYGLPADLITKEERMWQDMQVEQAKLSTNSSLVVASKAGHEIHKEEPQLVIDAILKVVQEARKR